MSYPVTGADVAGLLDALGKGGGDSIRWGQRESGSRHLDEVEALRRELAEVTQERDHAIEEADRAWESLCRKCREKRNP